MRNHSMGPKSADFLQVHFGSFIYLDKLIKSKRKSVHKDLEFGGCSVITLGIGESPNLPN